MIRKKVKACVGLMEKPRRAGVHSFKIVLPSTVFLREVFLSDGSAPPGIRSPVSLRM